MTMLGPGPIERRLRSRLMFKLIGHWPDAVVRERLAEDRRVSEQLMADYAQSESNWEAYVRRARESQRSE